MHALARTLATSSLVALVALSGCAAADGDPQPSTSADADAVTLDNCGTTLSFDEAPSRVVLLGFVSVAEVSAFIELGIEDSIIANMQSYGVSDDPTLVDRIAALPDGGLTVNENFGPSAEQVLALQPDLVVSTTAMGFDANLGFATREELSTAGAQSFITPARCADGNPDATPEELERYDTAGIDASVELIEALGTIFGVEDRAAEVVDGMQASLDETAAAIEDEPTVTGIVLSPGFTSDVPLTWTGGIVDDVLEHAGVENAFGGLGTLGGLDVSAEQLAAAQPDVLITFSDASVDEEAFVASLAEQFPDWPAHAQPTVVHIHDGLYLGTTNDEAVDAIARAAHPDAY